MEPGSYGNSIPVCCLQATLARLGVQNNSLADYVYIADNVFLNRPSPRLQVRCTIAWVTVEWTWFDVAYGHNAHSYRWSAA